VAKERAIALAVRDRDAEALKTALVGGGYLPADRADGVDAEFAMRLMRRATKWYAVPGERRFTRGHPDRSRDRRPPDTDRAPLDDDQRTEIRDQVNRFTVPPESILIRRMHAMVAIVLMQLEAGADWGAIAAEYLHGEPPSTPLGQTEAEFRKP